MINQPLFSRNKYSKSKYKFRKHYLQLYNKTSSIDGSNKLLPLIPTFEPINTIYNIEENEIKNRLKHFLY